MEEKQQPQEETQTNPGAQILLLLMGILLFILNLLSGVYFTANDKLERSISALFRENIPGDLILCPRGEEPFPFLNPENIPGSSLKNDMVARIGAVEGVTGVVPLEIRELYLRGDGGFKVKALLTEPENLPRLLPEGVAAEGTRIYISRSALEEVRPEGLLLAMNTPDNYLQAVVVKDYLAFADKRPLLIADRNIFFSLPGNNTPNPPETIDREKITAGEILKRLPLKSVTRDHGYYFELLGNSSEIYLQEPQEINPPAWHYLFLTLSEEPEKRIEKARFRGFLEGEFFEDQIALYGEPELAERLIKNDVSPYILTAGALLFLGAFYLLIKLITLFMTAGHPLKKLIPLAGVLLLSAAAGSIAGYFLIRGVSGGMGLSAYNLPEAPAAFPWLTAGIPLLLLFTGAIHLVHLVYKKDKNHGQ